MLYSLLFAFASLSTLTLSSSKKRIEKAVSVLKPDETNPIWGLNEIAGTVTFEKITSGKNKDFIQVSGEISGLKPNAQHGIHIHEFGDISNPKNPRKIDCLSTGTHYDPLNTKFHAGRNNRRGHLGDFGNIKSDRWGIAKFDFVDRFIELNGDFSIIGRGFVVHEKRDDLKSQPIGNAGGRPACGGINIAKIDAKPVCDYHKGELWSPKEKKCYHPKELYCRFEGKTDKVWRYGADNRFWYCPSNGRCYDHNPSTWFSQCPDTKCKSVGPRPHGKEERYCSFDHECYVYDRFDDKCHEEKCDEWTPLFCEWDSKCYHKDEWNKCHEPCDQWSKWCFFDSRCYKTDNWSSCRD